MKRSSCILLVLILFCLCLSGCQAGLGPGGIPAVGDLISLGRYEQDGKTENGAEPISWQVLAVDQEQRKALVISRYILDAQPYAATADSYLGALWSDCEVRTRLNSAFMDSAFNEKEKKAILLTEVDNSHAGCSVNMLSGGEDTQDRLFLLSYREIKEYMQDRTGEVTNHAVGQGVYSDGIYRDSTQARGCWWLRSPGITGAYAMYVLPDGTDSEARIGQNRIGVRPAMWIDLEQDAARSGFGKAAYTNTFPKDDPLFIGRGFRVTLGKYEQDGKTENGPEPIEWIVAETDREENKALLISVYGLDAKPYHETDESIRWETCSLREWLNGEFQETAFNGQEQEVIPLSEVPNSEQHDRNRNETFAPTMDYVFCLSKEEASDMFPSLVCSRSVPTEYARPNVIQASTVQDGAFGRWWTRTLEIKDGFEFVHSVYMDPFDAPSTAAVYATYYMVRPAVWMKLAAGE